MKKRSASLSHVHHAALAGLEAGVIESFGLEINNTYHDHLIYPLMVQAGIESFRFYGPAPISVRQNSFLSDRTILVDDFVTDYLEVERLVRSQAVDPESIGSNQDFHMLVTFLDNLFRALKDGCSVVLTLPTPNIRKLDGLLKPGFITLIENFLSNLTTLNIELPVPQLSVTKRDVAVVQQILTSDLFSTYADSHRVIETESLSNAPVKNMTDKAKCLQKTLSNTLDFGKATLSFLPLVAKTVDSIVGGTAGKLTTLFGDALLEAAKNKRNIILYDYRKQHLKLLINHYSSIKKAQAVKD